MERDRVWAASTFSFNFFLMFYLLNKFLPFCCYTFFSLSRTGCMCKSFCTFFFSFVYVAYVPTRVSQNIISLPKIDSRKNGHSASPKHAGEHAVKSLTFSSISTHPTYISFALQLVSFAMNLGLVSLERYSCIESREKEMEDIFFQKKQKI